jgi:phosphoenolpyruvate synthase/pyruvate phosphate dikinase
MTKYVYDFSEGNKDMKDLLGGKGANLAEMTNMGLPVPPGFTITTEACLAYLSKDDFPEGLMDEMEEHLLHLEQSMRKKLGDPEDPLLVSVRSGAKFSMPGMMDTVLNLGLNEDSLQGLAKQSEGDWRFAYDAYRRFIQMFGKIVMGVPGEAFEDALDRAKHRRSPNAQDTDLDVDDLKQLVEEFVDIYREHTGKEFPRDPREQLRLAVEAVFKSWNGKRAVDYRRQNKIPDDLGTAVNVVAMVFGNRGMDSGTGVAFTRDPATGEIAEVADFFSFGTNDLTQMGFGFSRDDIGKFVGMYEERKLVPANPFVTIDRAGIGRMMRIATEEGRAANPNLHVGICGEHGGDPASVTFCHEIGLDYVSCSPFRVETARLAAGQAAVGGAESASK